MNPLNRMRRALAVGIAAFALAACDTVEFQSAPGTMTTCDPALVGDWRAEDLRREPDDGVLYLRITAGCERWYSVGIERDATGNPIPDVDDLEVDLELGFARTDTQAFIAARDRPDPAKPAAPGDKPNGYSLVAYDRDDETLVLRQIDIKAVSHLIVDDVVPGWIEKRDRGADGSRNAMASGFWVFVFGSPKETRALLQTQDLLDAPWMRLLPVAAGVSAKLDGWIATSDNVSATTFESRSEP
jgi:hypothetical protein